MKFVRGVVPSLRMRDAGETIAFYRDVLGFKLTGAYPDAGNPDWVEFSSGPVTLQFFLTPPKGIGNPALSGTLYLYPKDVALLAKRLSGTVKFEWGPEVMDYGQLEFAVRDPNGYLLAFAEPTSEEGKA